MPTNEYQEDERKDEATLSEMAKATMDNILDSPCSYCHLSLADTRYILDRALKLEASANRTAEVEKELAIYKRAIDLLDSSIEYPHNPGDEAMACLAQARREEQWTRIDSPPEERLQRKLSETP